MKKIIKTVSVITCLAILIACSYFEGNIAAFENVGAKSENNKVDKELYAIKHMDKEQLLRASKQRIQVYEEKIVKPSKQDTIEKQIQGNQSKANKPLEKNNSNKNSSNNNQPLKTSNTNSLEKYVNDKGYSSKSSYLIWVDKSKQKVNVFSGSKSNWKLVSSMACSTGAARTPTPSGTFTISGRGSWFVTNYGVGAKYWTRFYGNYLFHSIIMDRKGRIIDSSLGRPKSHGCIRLSLDNAKWINTKIPDGTKVIIS